MPTAEDRPMPLENELEISGEARILLGDHTNARVDIRLVVERKDVPFDRPRVWERASGDSVTTAEIAFDYELVDLGDVLKPVDLDAMDPDSGYVRRCAEQGHG